MEILRRTYHTPLREDTVRHFLSGPDKVDEHDQALAARDRLAELAYAPRGKPGSAAVM